ncbi:MAG: 2-amino-4-hydroxy-6-hydroxymethyldihydropteridine diphosphokinase [Acidobacteriota bacterium]|nr:2-amino-4-hydroxy-6-hydroxymethyldihydropteridine diphosphokinase [Acidobacteriota bacterium]
MEDVFLSLGSNLGDRAATLRAALARLAKLGRVAAASSLYESEPVDYTAQPWFLNAVVQLNIDAGDDAEAPHRLLTALHAIEHDLGRCREGAIPKGPRPIDIDILLYGARVLRTADLTVPHAAMHERRFVLEPLVEIAPEVRHPALRRTARELLASLAPGQQLRRLGPFLTAGIL